MIEQKIGYLLRRLNSTLSHYETGKQNGMDITPTQGILLHGLLTNGGEAIFLSDICKISGLSKASVSSILKVLKKKGYLTMESLSEDERKKDIILTEKAYKIQEKLEQEMEQRSRAMCRGITEEEQKVLENLLNRMIENLKIHQD